MSRAVKFPVKRRAGLHKKRGRRLDWKQREMEVAPTMVRGTNRQVVVVRSPDPRIFEEAIFIVRDDLFRQGNSADKVLSEARQAANAYLRQTTGVGLRPRRAWRRIPASLFAAAGAAVAGIAWLAFHFVGV